MRRVAEIIAVVLVIAGCVQQPQMLEHAPTATHVSQATTTVQPSAAAVSGHPTKIPTPTPTPDPTPEPTATPTEEPKPTDTPEPPPPTPKPTATKEAERESESRYQQIEDGKYVYVTESGEELVIPEMANTYQKFALVDGKPFVIYLAESQNPWGLTGETPQERLVGIAFPETYIADRDESGAEIREQVCAVGLVDQVVRPRLQVASVEDLEIPLFVDPTTASGENSKLVLQDSAGQGTGVVKLFITAPRGSLMVVPFEVSEQGLVLVKGASQNWGGSTISVGNERGLFPDSDGTKYNFYIYSAGSSPSRQEYLLGDRFHTVPGKSFTDEILRFFDDRY